MYVVRTDRKKIRSLENVNMIRCLVVALPDLVALSGHVPIIPIPRAKAGTVKNTGDGIQETGEWRMERNRWALQAAPLQRSKVTSLRAWQRLESSMSIAGRSSSWEGNSNQTEDFLSVFKFKKWVVRLDGAGRSRSRVGVGYGDEARRYKGSGRSTFCG